MTTDTTPSDARPSRPAAPRTGPPWLHAAQGMAMGTADVIPGVSGGTIALIVGIYTSLIEAIRSVASAGTAVLRGRGDLARRHWQAVPWGFVLPLGGGIVVALGIGSVVLPPLLESHPEETSAVFAGMIVASLAVPWRQVRPRGPLQVGVALVCAVAAFLLTGLPEAVVEGDVALWRVFASAAVAICAMILPGVSGAFLLLVLGVYEPTLDALRSLDVVYVGVFVVGAVVGLGAFSKLLSHLLAQHLAVTMAGLTGLMVGALRVLWPWGGHEGELHAPADVTEAAVGLGLFAVGFAIVRVLLVMGDRSTAPGSGSPPTSSQI
ncbi:DUF368 domain-containing protein [Euzebya sp.]|uniref:DUF368 domain-containing protein n=1 Tax=Euzebya sp. TaxID=1971409 RepID=UPI00351734C4